MPHSPLISIIQCDNPNKLSSRIHNRNYLIYIATRDGVDLTPVELERELQQLAEIENPDSDHASNELYLKYIHERPGSQGLFGNVDTSNPYQLGNEIENLTAKGHLIYRGIISLTEDDALNLGFDQKEAWVNYLNSVMPDIAAQFNIPISKLQWTAAFHIKDGHPHCHYMFWSKDRQVASPFIHVSKQHAVRELLSKEMFQLEREQAVITKTVARDLLVNTTKKLAEDELQFLLKNPDRLTGFFNTKDVKAFSKEMINLTTALPSSGRLAYKLLPKEVKEQVDSLVDKMLKTQPLALDYYQYLNAVDDISASYSASKSHSEVTHTIADEDLRKRLGNVVLKTCKQLLQEKELLSNYISNVDESTSGEPGSPEHVFKTSSVLDSSYEQLAFNFDSDSISEANIDSGEPGSPELAPDYIMSWNSNYKKAISMLYDDAIENKTGVFTLLSLEAKQNNVLALHQLAQLYERGTFTEKNPDIAAEYYNQAYQGFKTLLSEPAYKKMHSYICYRLGKYYENGLGTEQNYEQAIKHYENALDNKYAQYSLGNMYLRQKGITITAENKEQVQKEVAQLFKASADAGFLYAAYSYAKLCESNPVLLPISKGELDNYYTLALNEFEKTVSNRPDDNLFYRLGTMYYEGKGAKPNQELAFSYFTKAAEYNNPFAQYALGKTYADSNSGYFDLTKAEEMFKLSSAHGNEYATFALGKLYATPGPLYNPIQAENLFNKTLEVLPDASHYALGKMYNDKENPLFNLRLAIEHLQISSDLNNDNAQYDLAKIYLQKDSEHYNFEKGFRLLQQAVENDNAYAMGKLGSLYLWGTNELKADEPLGKYWLNKAIENGNPYAKETLTMYDNFQKDIAVGFTFSLCRNLLRCCSSRQKPESIDRIVAKVMSREAAKDREKKSEQTH